MKYCVPEDKPWMCPTFQKINCARKYGENYILFPDGICRLKDDPPPSQIVCPIGKVLCANLSCIDNHYLCPNSTETPAGTQRCINQDVKKDSQECASTITCLDKDQVVCYNGDYVKNEILCNLQNVLMINLVIMVLGLWPIVGINIHFAKIDFVEQNALSIKTKKYLLRL